MYTHTKIICTLGPSSNSLEMIIELIKTGMNVARINFSHGTHEEHFKTIQNIKEAREKTNIPISIMLDTKGPEIRVGELKNDVLELKTKQKVKLIRGEAKNDDEIPINPFEVLKILKPSQKILFDDGYISAKVIEKDDDYILIEIQNNGILKSKKSINIPNVQLSLPAVTEQDIKDLKFGCENDIDIVAASFIRSADHVLEIKKILHQNNCSDVSVIAKIESAEGVDNFDEIAEAADGIMVARGDLGVEVDLSLVPKLQKIMIHKCYDACKPVVIATQMLESMIQNPRPTRAEVSDVANAIYDSSSAVMLSAETASGKYPIETVRQMKKIIHETESDFDYKDFFYKESHHIEYKDISSSVAVACVKTAYSSDAKAIFAMTRSGFTARLLTRLRPQMPILVLTNVKKKYHQLAFIWGVIPIFDTHWSTEREAFAIISKFAEENEIISFGDYIVLASSYPFEKRGETNLMIVESIGNILLKGVMGVGKKIKGQVLKILSLNDDILESARDKILLITKCDDRYLKLLKVAKGVILQNSSTDTFSENFLIQNAKLLDLPSIIRVKHAFDLLEDNETILLEPEKALIYLPKENNLK